MSIVASTVQAAAELVRQVPDPSPEAPAELVDRVNTMLSLIMWLTIAAAAAVMVTAGLVTWAGERGYGGGMSQQMQSLVGRAVIALVIIGSASRITTWVMG